MRRTILAYTVALGLSLFVGYVSWTHEPERTHDDEIEVLHAKADTIREITFRSPHVDVAVTRRADAQGDYFWVELTKQASAPSKPEPEPEPEDADLHDHDHGAQGSAPEEARATNPDSSADDAGPSARAPTAAATEAPDASPSSARAPTAAATEAPDASSSARGSTVAASEAAATVPASRAGSDPGHAESASHASRDAKRDNEETTATALSFKGGEGVDDLLDALAPLKARRVLTSVPAERLDEFGFTADAARLTVTRDGHEPSHFDVGRTMFGGRTAYLRDTTDDRVFVVDAKIVRLLRDADARLVERRLFAAEPKQIVRVTVVVGDAEQSYMQHHADDPSAAYWSREGQQERDDAADTWIKKAIRLRASRSKPAGDDHAQARERFNLVIATRDGVTTRVHVLEAPAPNTDAPATWWARSDFTRATVPILEHLASDLAATATDVSATDGE
ncbi:MAG: DUF4340 domain-containing protein [Myxococcales bacterium FL481]|nr:MAG: DUF4340 domain-containing protein [Myxococcales bacterium FL481]